MSPNIDGFPNYHIKPTGEVVNLKTGRVLKGVLNSEGYVVFCLTHNKKKKVLKQHRMLAKAYIPNPDNKPHINHIDSDRSNNELSNLEWVTPKENMFHARDNNRFPEKEKKSHKITEYDKSLLTRKQAKFVEVLNELGYPKDVMEHLDIAETTFYRMLKRIKVRLGIND